MKEPILEPLLRRARLGRVLPYIRQYPRCRLLDIGCGWEAKLLRSFEPYIENGIGVDFKAPALKTEKLETLSITLAGALPFGDASFDVVTMLAVLEHLDQPEQMVKEISRVLRPQGRLVLTVPSWYAKPVLEFLAFRLKIVSREEILDHKRYYNRADLYALIGQAPPLKVVTHKYFQGVFNNLLVAQKCG